MCKGDRRRRGGKSPKLVNKGRKKESVGSPTLAGGMWGLQVDDGENGKMAEKEKRRSQRE